MNSVQALHLTFRNVILLFKLEFIRKCVKCKTRSYAFLIPELNNHLQRVKLLHKKDLAEGFGTVFLPFALERKYPNASKEWNWQYVFPSRNLSIDPRSGKTSRHHFDQSVVNKAIKRAVQHLGITKKVSAHTFRHSFATHLLHAASILERFRRYWVITNRELPKTGADHI